MFGTLPLVVEPWPEWAARHKPHPRKWTGLGGGSVVLVECLRCREVYLLDDGAWV